MVNQIAQGGDLFALNNRQGHGGTHNCVKYAESVHLTHPDMRIINVWNSWVRLNTDLPKSIPDYHVIPIQEMEEFLVKLHDLTL